MFQKGQSGNPAGRKPGEILKKTKIENLLTAKVIDDTFRDDFIKGVPFVRQLAYEHYYGKPENKNLNVNKYPDFIKMITGPEQKEESNNGQTDN